MPISRKTKKDKKPNLSPIQKKRILSILEEAEAYFVEKGIAESKMEEIAERIGVSRQTLYRYYSTKEDLAFAVEVRVLNRILGRLKDLFLTASDLSLKELESVMKQVSIDFLREHEQQIRFTAIFDSYFIKYQGLEYIDTIRSTVSSYPNPFKTIIEKEQRMGNVSPLLDAAVTGEMITHSMLSLSQRVLIRREALQAEYGFDPLELVPLQLSFFIRGIACSPPEA